MFTGLTLLAWILGLTVLYGCYLLACAMHREPTAVDVYCARVDQEIDATEAFYADLARNGLGGER